MEEKINNPLALSVKWPYIIRFGSLAGLLTIGVTLIGYLFAGDTISFQQQGFFSFGSFILIFFLTSQAIKIYRNENLNGFIHFKDSFQIAAAIGAICGFVGSLFNLIYLSFIDTGYVDVLVRQMEEMYLSMGMSEGQVEKVVEKLKDGFNFSNLALGLITGPIIYGLIVGLVGGLIGRKKNNLSDLS